MSILHFLEACEALKRIPRTGWLLRGVLPGSAETIAEHSFSTTIIAFLLGAQSGQPINHTRLLLMALLHDLPESQIGDIPISAEKVFPRFREIKQEAEQQVMLELLNKLPKEIKHHLEDIWRECKSGDSFEAKLVEAADRIATAFHALTLIRTGYKPELFASFFDHTEKTISSLQIPSVEAFFKELRDSFE
jgi:putative hydrolase of HD superfamily